MRFDVNDWVNNLTEKLKNVFLDRLLFVGLQGSYRRGEAKPDSDIDIVVILDELTIDDLKKYKSIINSMPEKKKACGFISGKREINNWPKMDIFQFKNDTMPILGSLDGLIPIVEKKDVEAYVKISCSNLYHMAVHNYLYENDINNLKLILKSMFFIFQAVHYIRTGVYVSSKKELYSFLKAEEKDMFDLNMDCLSAQELDIVYDKIIKYLKSGFCL